MILPIFRPIFHDELFYGWIDILAQANYKDDVRGMQRVAGILFPYSYSPDRRFIPSKEPLRMDFIRGIGESLERHRTNYTFPETWDFLAYNTTLYAMGISRSDSTQARYLYTALSSVYGDMMDMPTLPSSVKEIKICPICMSEGEYIRTWHCLPGVKACAVHRARLLRRDEIGKPSILTEDEPDVVYAKYCKDIFDYPSTVSLNCIKTVLKPDCTSEELAILSRKSTNFEAVVDLLIRHKLDYKSLVNTALGFYVNDSLNGYDVIRECNGIVEVSCKSCGHVFTGASKAIAAGFGCPICMRSVHPTEFVSSILSSIGDGRYRLAEPFRGMGAVQCVIHDTCGKSQPVRMTSRLWDKQTCRCETAHRIQDLQQEIDHLSPGYKIVSYTPTNGDVSILHTRCEVMRTCKLLTFRSHPGCPHCRAKEARERDLRKLALLLGPEYTVQMLPSKGNTFTVIHKPCGTKIDGTFRQFQGTAQKGPRRCPICSSYFIKKKDSGTTAEGKLYLDMQAWFATHKTWVSRRHPEYHCKKYYDALIVLEKKGKIFRISPGIYAERNDLSVYDVLKEKYLVDDNGEICGRFINGTADYFVGTASEPDIISLESALLARKSVYRTVVCGRKIDIRGC